MDHNNKELKLSMNEASMASEATIRRLLATRKLSLVVDLDMCVIHAGLDPTIGDWMRDEANPNHPAVKDVQTFKLWDRDPTNMNLYLCTYYIKMRPGLKNFLQEMSKKYELHVYTAGTRIYARNVVNIIDPEQKIFGDRVITRDESGSSDSKSLWRLFPVDTKMVTIIDDRADVWKWSPNLIRVTPYDFFKGIGDINNKYLPPQEDIFGSISPAPASDATAVNAAPAHKSDEEGAEKPVEKGEDYENATGEVKTDGSANPTIEEKIVAMAGSKVSADVDIQDHKQHDAIMAQVEERPLLKKQELLDKQDEEEAIKEQSESGTDEPASESHPVRRHRLLVDDDTELVFVQGHLENVYQTFWTEYERNLASSQGGRVAELRGDKRSKKPPTEDLNLIPDITQIIPRIKQDVLAGVVVCFTGVISQETPHNK